MTNTKQYDAYSDLITFTRASSGTALRRVGYGAELVTNGDFSNGTTGWATKGTATISYSAVEDALEVNVTGSGGGFEESQSLVTEIGKVYLVSITVKKTTFSGNIHWNIDGTNYGSFTPTTDYQTFSKAFVATDTSMDVGFPRESSPTGIYFVREVSVKEVIFDRSTDPLVLFNHPTNVPRIEYDADGNRLGLLIEEARTNSFTNSGDMDGSGWAGFRTTFSNGDTAPDGSQLFLLGTASETNVNGSSVAQQALTLSAGTYTMSVFAKAGPDDAGFLCLRPSDNASFIDGVQAWFNLETGSVGAVSSVVGSSLITTPSANIQDFGGGVYRCILTFTVTGSVTCAPRHYISDANGLLSVTIGKQVQLWGAQLEAGSFATSYIGTSGATATRSPDVASIPTTAFGHNQKAGTLMCEFESVSSINQRSVSLNDGTSNNAVQIVVSTSGGGSLVGEIRTSATGQMFQPSPASITAGQYYKIAMAYAENDGAVSRDGTLGTDSSVVVPIVSNLFIGAGTSSFAFLNGHIKSIQYYPRRLTNAQLQELTA